MHANVEKATPYVINNGNNVKKYTLRGKCKKNNDGDEHRDSDTVHFINIIMQQQSQETMMLLIRNG